MTAVILKWIEFTTDAVVFVKGSEGMLDWWRASESAKRYSYSALRRGMELPANSLAAQPLLAISTADFRVGMEHPGGVWFPGMPVREMVIASDRYDMTISVLVIDAPATTRIFEEEPDNDMTTTPPRF